MPRVGSDYPCGNCSRITAWKELANNGWLCNKCVKK